MNLYVLSLMVKFMQILKKMRQSEVIFHSLYLLMEYRFAKNQA
jgi:hypothetical protein